MFHCFEARTVILQFTSSGCMQIHHVDGSRISAAHLVEVYFYKLLSWPTHLAHLSLLKEETFQPSTIIAMVSSALSHLLATLLVMSFPSTLCHSAWLRHPWKPDLSQSVNSLLMKSTVKIMHKMVLFWLRSKLNVNLLGEIFTNMQDIPKRC